MALPSALDRLKSRLKLDFTEDVLRLHLEHEYGADIVSLTALDFGVFKVEWANNPVWVARVHPADRPVEAVLHDAIVLQYLEQLQFPAERCAHAKPVTVLSGHPVIVTAFISGVAARGGPKTLRRLGALLARLNGLGLPENGTVQDAGAWHHMSASGGPMQDLVAARTLLNEIRAASSGRDEEQYIQLELDLDNFPDFSRLPQALIHPDFVPSNIISVPGGLVPIDWSGAGRGPRILGLGFLLYAAGVREMPRVDEVLEGYLAQIKLEPEEYENLADAVAFRPIIISCWELFMDRNTITASLQKIAHIRELARDIAARCLSTRGAV